MDLDGADADVDGAFLLPGLDHMRDLPRCDGHYLGLGPEGSHRLCGCRLGGYYFMALEGRCHFDDPLHVRALEHHVKGAGGGRGRVGAGSRRLARGRVGGCRPRLARSLRDGLEQPGR